MQHGAPPPRMARRSFLSTGEAAALACCHRTTILRAAARGELEAVRLGRHGDYRIPAEAFAEWLRPANPQETP